MKNFKRLTAAVLAAALTAMSLPSVTAEEYISVFDVMKTAGAVDEVKAGEESPAEDFEYEVNGDGESVTITKYVGSGGDVVIPSVIEGKRVTNIGSAAFYLCTSITSVKIPDSVRSINSSYVTEDPIGAFSYCTSLTSVYIPNSVTNIGSKAFLGCASLTSVEIPNSVTQIGWYAFYKCASITSIKIPNSVTSISNGTFIDCTSLTSVEIPDSVTKIEKDSFYSCTSLTSVEIPSSVTEIGRAAFGDCTSLKSINVDRENINYSSVNGILFNKEKTTLIQYPAGKSESYIIPSGVRRIDDCAFLGCASLTSVEIPNSVTWIGIEVFSGCTSLISVEIPSSVTSISRKVFFNCTSLTSVYIPNSVTEIGPLSFSNCISLTSVKIPGSVTKIGYSAFAGCTSLTSVEIPNSMTEIEWNAFGDCTFLTIYGHENSSAQVYAEENEIPFKIIGKEAAIDHENNIIIENPNLEGKILEVNKSADSTEEKIIYNITLKDEKGKEIQPEGEVTVKIPLPDGWKNAAVSRCEQDGTLTDMKAVCENGYMVFVTDHFSEYVIEKKPDIQIADLNSDGKITTVDAKWVLQAVSGSRELTPEQEAAADVNGDGKITTVDAKWILQAVSGSRDLG